jgi:hypothetical protein
MLVITPGYDSYDYDSYELMPEINSPNSFETVAVLSFPLLFVLIWIEASRFTRHFWQVAPVQEPSMHRVTVRRRGVGQ